MNGRTVWNALAWTAGAWILLQSNSPAQISSFDDRFVLGVNGSVKALTVHDDGTGQALFVAGQFSKAGNLGAAFIAKLQGRTWSALGPGPNAGTSDAVNALAEYNDGSGLALYAAGEFTFAGGAQVNKIAKWKPSTGWTPLGLGIPDAGTPPLLMPTHVHSLAVYDDGTGPALFVAGDFPAAGGIPANNIAKWNGAAWTALGAGTNAPVRSLVVHDDGTGPALYAGGSFTSAGGATANGIARWNGASWTTLSTGVSGPGASVKALAVYSNTLFAGGQFSQVGGVAANNIAAWNGAGWSPLAAGVSGTVETLAVHNTGGVNLLIVGGTFSSASGVLGTANLARWNGAAWASTGVAFQGSVQALASMNTGAGPELFAGGAFVAGQIASADRIFNHIGFQGAADWRPIGMGVNGQVYCVENFDDGAGSAVYCGGTFTAADGQTILGLGRIRAGVWEPVGAGTLGVVRALKAARLNGSNVLVMAGQFSSIGGIAASNIAQWNGVSWKPLGVGTNGIVRSLAVFDDGTGESLYAGGAFTTAGGVTVNGIARWDGSSWTALCSSGVCGLQNGPFAGVVECMDVFDDGTGPALVVGGQFVQAGPLVSNDIAKWTSGGWVGLGGGFPSYPAVTSVGHILRSPPLGPLLVAGVRQGLSVASLEVWSGGAWSPVDTFQTGPSAGPVLSAMRPYGEPGTQQLVIGGTFATNAAGTPFNNVATYDGTTLAPIGVGISGGSAVGVLSIQVHEQSGQSSPELILGGNFSSAGGAPATNLTALTGSALARIEALCPGAFSIQCPCANNGAPGHGCENSSATGGALLVASGWSGLGNDTLVLSASGEKPAATSWFLEATATTAAFASGDGLLCLNGTPKILYTKTAVGGSVTAPGVGDPPVHLQALMNSGNAGTRRYYQVMYRDTQNYCTTQTFNYSSGVGVLWLP